MLPYYPIKDNGAFHWEIYSYSNKMIADYCNMPITNVKALSLDEWLCIVGIPLSSTVSRQKKDKNI